MKRIALLVTGKLEQQALAKALERWTVEQGHQVNFSSDQWPSFTSCNLANTPKQRPTGNLRSNAGKLAATALAKLTVSPPADFVIIVDDLELVNQPHPHLVTEHFRKEAQSVGQASPGALGLLASRVSLHLAVPMIESWLFPDCQALLKAGSRRVMGLWSPSSDAEAFAVTDRQYDCWSAKEHPAATVRSDLHPKRYLNFLTGGTYSETWVDQHSQYPSGAAALAALNWSKVPQPSPHMAYLHALLDDLSDMLGATYPQPVPSGTGTQRRSGGVLRNL